jgi:hypothetical protein
VGRRSRDIPVNRLMLIPVSDIDTPIVAMVWRFMTGDRTFSGLKRLHQLGAVKKPRGEDRPRDFKRSIRRVSRYFYAE